MTRATITLATTDRFLATEVVNCCGDKAPKSIVVAKTPVMVAKAPVVVAKVPVVVAKANVHVVTV